MIEFVEPEDVDDLIEIEGFHYRDRNLMLSALASPMPVFGTDVFPNIHEKAAVLFMAINHNHPLLDGNKRIAWYVVAAFYELNGYDLIPPRASVADQWIRSAAASKGDRDEVTKWFESRAHAIQQSSVD